MEFVPLGTSDKIGTIQRRLAWPLRKDDTHKSRNGVIEDVLLQIEHFIFLVDFIILDDKADEKVPIILKHLLLDIEDAIIKVMEDKMITRVVNKEVVFNVYQAIQLPRHYEDLAMISVVEVDEPVIDSS
ncbi:hypothetical protein A4A49_52264 [Nicotiana attenuata]|uniref:Uncharacterized protein n=1 Tax=Nicotiana attenuata TaxID=49451 RepID=A0A314L667_NICAT|nr:hypothetical protein A4A49_52264 [Nicotiana attenuata]